MEFLTAIGAKVTATRSLRYVRSWDSKFFDGMYTPDVTQCIPLESELEFDKWQFSYVEMEIRGGGTHKKLATLKKASHIYLL